MDSYRPGDNDPRVLRDYRGSDDDNSDSGFQIRGAARHRRTSDSRARSSSRRPYYDPDMPRQRGDEYRGDHHSRSDERYDHTYSSSSDYAGRNYRGRGYNSREDYRRDERDRRYDSRGYQERNYRDYHDYHDYSEPDPYSEPREPPASTGLEDVSPEGAPLKFLLIRGLKNTVDEALLSKGLEKLDLDDNDPKPTAMMIFPGGPPPIATPAAPPGATPGSLKRVFLIRDRLSEKSLSYGFAEYHTLSDAKAALAKAAQLADKCTIASKQITVDFPHTGVFPISEPAKDPRFTFQLSNGSIHRYRDGRYYASALDVNANPPLSQETPAEAKSKPSKKRTANLQTLDSLDATNEMRKKAKTKTAGSLAITSRWRKTQAQLNGEDGEEEDDEEEPDPNPIHPPNPVDPPISGANLDSGIVAKENQSFIAKGKNKGEDCWSCYLCGTNLPQTVTPDMHVKGSATHKKHLDDDDKCQQGYDRLEKKGIDVGATIKLAEEQFPEQPQYRDRAKERRKEQAKTGGGKLKLSLKNASQKAGAVDTKPVAPSYGKGMAMLQKAGWEEGQGLGSGGGIAAPIDQLSYAAGVGLGHESSKKGNAAEEAARSTRGDGFLEKTKEVARERFSRMG